ncbi:hypothetical protein, partial [Burkholderia pseudomallei]|uniref:hypothetical protein n=2 Tax=Burkholderia pseudomallei TaxID=28450 RepID=UPI001C83F729
FVLRGHGRLQHHAIKKQKPPTWRGFVSNLSRPRAAFSHPRSTAGTPFEKQCYVRRRECARYARKPVATGFQGAIAAFAAGFFVLCCAHASFRSFQARLDSRNPLNGQAVSRKVE